MKIALIGPNHGGEQIELQAFRNFLTAKGHEVRICYTGVATRGFKLVHEVKRRLDHLSLHERIINKLEQEVKEEHFDVLISIGNMDIMNKVSNCRKIFFYPAPAPDEYYFAWAYEPHRYQYLNLKGIKDMREKEIELFKTCDYVVFPWECDEEYIRKYVYDGDNFLTIRHGCTPRERTVSYFFPPSIVYLGALERYWNNMELLSHLTRITPNIIDVYGSPKPKEKYNLRYRGFAPTLDVFYDYQFGLQTVSKEILRRYGFSAKILDYLSYGLPCLFPEWQKFPHELGGCVPYNEDNFLEVLEKYSEKSEWHKLSQQAIEQARELSWDKTLQPLLKLMGKAD